MLGELADDSEAQFQQERWWQIRRLRAEGGRTYFGKPAARHGIVTGDGVIQLDCAAGGSGGHSVR